MKMKYDKELDIATGLSRTQKTWTNTKMKWSALVSRLSKTTRTPETIEQYKKMPKTKQDEIKDVGGFVGGYLINGRRSDVKYRQVICLDIDFGGLDLWDAFEVIYCNAAVMYSTHKHSPSNPRLRLVVPLDRKVSSEEYQAIARKLAETLDINAFDDTTYQPQRLMYWPSTSQDGDYVFRYLDEEFLSADEMLAQYEDWTDVTAWPFSSREGEAIRREMKKQQDPLSKPGLVGAFCRAYNIHEAIEMFVEDYEPCAIDNRYTYTKGSTSAGVVTYNDVFSFSHHGTDPASSVLCNAFDLVRLHRFRELDDDVRPDTKATSLPSFKAMTDFVSQDARVKKEIIDSQIDAFDVLDDSSETDDREWTAQLDIGKQGNILSTYNNIILILKNDPNLKGKFGYNELSKTECILGDLPWRKYSRYEQGISDTDDANLRIYFEKKYSITGKERIFDACNSVCHDNSFHPIKQYLESLEWDGIPRLDTLFIDNFACEDNEYVRTVSRKTLLAAVTRVYEPGCHFDTMLTLKGTQGCGKSSFLRKLSKGWFTDSLKDIKSKDALEGLQGVWIVEMGELSALKKADAETIKSFLSGTSDRFRMAYGRRTKDYPRQCIFIATTNETEFLRDKTGNRRFWIISASKTRTPKKDVFKITDYEIDQIWAETKSLYDAGVETLHLDKEMEEVARIVQESYMMEDPKDIVINEYLDRLLPENWDDMDLYDRQLWISGEEVGTIPRTKVCAAEIWCEALGYADTKGLTQYESAEINKIIDARKDWVKHPSSMRFRIYGTKRGYKKVSTE